MITNYRNIVTKHCYSYIFISTQVEQLPVLAEIAPPALRREAATLVLGRRACRRACRQPIGSNTIHILHCTVLSMIGSVIKIMSDGNLTAVCSFDITKCFDTINHSILLRKMEYYGLQSENIKWFKSYLNEREQMVSCHNTVSGKSTISIGVPQGSVLGPLLFLIYVNDINRHVHLGACNLYADDTLVYCNGSTMSELKHNIQQCVSDIHEWYDKNKLVINKSKSSVMLATTRQRILHIDNNDLDVHIGDYKLVQSDCIDHLGLKIDETISWNMQTDNICKKLVFIISRFSRLKHILPSHMLMLIYSSIIQPKFDYAITIWGYTCDNNLHKIQRLQNRAARIITGNYDYVTTRGTELVRRLRWMCVTQRRNYFMSILTYR